MTNPDKIEPKPTNPPQQIKKYSEAEVGEVLRNRVLPDCDPRNIISRIAELLPEYVENKQNKKVSEELDKYVKSAWYMDGLDNFYSLLETVSENYRPLMIVFGKQLIEEFNCTGASEKVLVQAAVLAYGRILEYTKRFNGCVHQEYLSNEKNGFYAMLSKEIDRANRHLLSAITTLRQLKTPPLKVNIKTNTAFVAQNQQLNNSNPTPDEINKV